MGAGSVSDCVTLWASPSTTKPCLPVGVGRLLSASIPWWVMTSSFYPGTELLGLCEHSTPSCHAWPRVPHSCLCPPPFPATASLGRIPHLPIASSHPKLLSPKSHHHSPPCAPCSLSPFTLCSRGNTVAQPKAQNRTGENQLSASWVPRGVFLTGGITKLWLPSKLGDRTEHLTQKQVHHVLPPSLPNSTG
jgi:hypothetical protein